MKKFFKNALWLSKLALVSCCLLVAACDEDEDENKLQTQTNATNPNPGSNGSNGSTGGTTTSPALVGAWKQTFSTSWCLIVFNSDGTGYETGYEEDDHNIYETFSYSYDASNGKLYIYYDDENEEGDYDYYKVVSMSNGILELWYEGDPDEREVFYKQ